MLRGFATVNHWADDLEGAKEWYTELLGIEPYFERPGYYEFRLGDYGHELGLIDSRYAPASSAAAAAAHGRSPPRRPQRTRRPRSRSSRRPARRTIGWRSARRSPSSVPDSDKPGT
jgi:catechol 2,3-dioxygenase-like lactoylglutathione lyase family enzyme